MKAIELPFTVHEGADEDIVTCNCCPNASHVGALDQEWVFDNEEDAALESNSCDSIPSPK
jgi:hypothetical protein